ncbi:hypothetical protein IWX63_001378 [Arthrobacter sp. CAN_A2]|uniref:hypothetical protein n=1 Tax=Arthrobacter sp. CAN_A2 TaxID=2787718 RepID=UPI0018F052DA
MCFLPPLTLLAALSFLLDDRLAPRWVRPSNVLFPLISAIPSCMIGWFMLWIGVARILHR